MHTFLGPVSPCVQSFFILIGFYSCSYYSLVRRVCWLCLCRAFRLTGGDQRQVGHVHSSSVHGWLLMSWKSSTWTPNKLCMSAPSIKSGFSHLFFPVLVLPIISFCRKHHHIALFAQRASESPPYILLCC